jgi:chaperonin GroES
MPQASMEEMPQPATNPVENTDESSQARDISALILSTNIAEDLDEEQLNKIGNDAHQGWQIDVQSRQKWIENSAEAIKLALLVKESKSFPWPDASNVKYPLIATASMQFGARAYPTLVPSNGKIVKAKIIGADMDGQKAKRAQRIEKHMSWQLLDQMEEWEEEHDKLLFITAIVGTAFKKTYFDSQLKRNVSKLIHPRDLVVNYWAKSIEMAPRVSEEFELYKNEVVSRIRAGIYLDRKLSDPTTANVSAQTSSQRDKLQGQQPSVNDFSTPYLFVEQHTWLDLDNDDYMEPYIVTFETSSKKVVRIVANYTQKDMEVNEKNKIIRIKPFQYYTKFTFIPNPDGGFYDLGFGQLLGGINASVDTLINQLIDAGTLNNLQGGFLSKALKLRAGDQRFKPGEWKQVPMTSDDLRKAIVPLPSKDPSQVLMHLLGMLIQSGKELASIAEIFVGKMPGQNTPAYTTKETVEQGMKLFTAIYKRIYRSMASEFRKLFILNSLYLDPQEEVNILDEPISDSDYNLDSVDIIPAADPNAASMNEKASKFTGVMQLMPLGQLDPAGVTMMGLTVLDLSEPEIKSIVRQGPPPPNPKQQEMQAKMQMEQQKAQTEQVKAQQQMQMKQAEAQIKAQMSALDLQIKQAEGEQKIKLQAELAAMKMQSEQIKAYLATQAAMQQSEVQAQASNQKLVQGEAQHQQKLKQIKEQQKAKPKGGDPNARRSGKKS